MRSNRVGITLCIIAGSFFLYCGQSAVTMIGHNHADGGAPRDGSSFAPDAYGQSSGGTCCTAPARETPTVIFDDLVKTAPIAASPGCTQASPVFDVSAYRTVVVHSPYGFVAQVRNGKAGFVAAAVSTSVSLGSNQALPGVLQLDTMLGHELRINFAGSITSSVPDGSASCDNPGIPLTVVGYRNP